MRGKTVPGRVRSPMVLYDEARKPSGHATEKCGCCNPCKPHHADARTHPSRNQLKLRVAHAWALDEDWGEEEEENPVRYLIVADLEALVSVAG